MSKPSPQSNAVTEWTLPGSDGQPILGCTHAPPQGQTPVGHVVICQGFKGYMDYGFLPRLAHTLAGLGVAAHRFNFSHSGVTRDFETFAHPELFERDTWNRQVFDLTQVIEYFGKQNNSPLAVFGHSRGGITALLAASRLPTDHVARVITAASPADAGRLEPEARDMLLRTGRLASPSGRTGQMLHVGQNWLTEIEADPDAHDPLLASAKLAGRATHLHGDDDATIPVEDCARYATANSAATTHVIPNANHVFNAPNPLALDADLAPQTAALFGHTLQALADVFGALAPPS